MIIKRTYCMYFDVSFVYFETLHLYLLCAGFGRCSPHVTERVTPTIVKVARDTYICVSVIISIFMLFSIELLSQRLVSHIQQSQTSALQILLLVA